MFLSNKVKHLGIVTGTLIFTVFCILLSLVIYLVIAFFTIPIRPFGVIVSLVTPAIIAPPICMTLLWLARSFYRTQEELKAAQKDLEKKVADRTQELSNTNEQLINEIQERKQTEEERKRAEEALQESENRFRRLAENARDMIFRMTLPDGKYEYISPASCDITGFTPEEYYNGTMNLKKIIHPDFIEYFNQQWENLLEGNIPPFYEYKIIHKKGGERWLYQRNVLVLDENGLPIAMEGIVTDLTEHKHTEEKLLRAQKLESLGILAGGIAHDFNNLMAVIMGNIELAIRELPMNHTSYPLLKTALQSGRQTKDLTGRLITFSKGGFPVRRENNISEILLEAVQKMAKNTNIQVIFEIAENLRAVEADENQIRQVFYNLTVNAIEAMPEGGILTIQAQNAEVQSTDSLPIKEGSYIRIDFADNGAGIDKENLLHVFDPYFTTKDMGAQKGTGLGLSVCYSILKKHGGHIDVASRPGEGTTFILYFPALFEKIKEATCSFPSSRCRVLIMEDEEPVRIIERAFLEKLGYGVTETKDGQEAFDCYKEARLSQEPFALVILDLVVHQGLGGQLTMERLLKEDPSVKAIIASGYMDEPAIEHYKDYGFQGALKKPFSFDEFEKMVKSIIDSKA